MNARDRFRRWLCTHWWRIKHGREHDAFHIPATGLKPNHLAVVMPPEFHDFEAALPVLLPLIEQLSPVQATLLMRDNFRSWLPRDHGLRVISFDLNDAGWLGFPKPDLLKRARQVGADLVVDLTPGFYPFTNGLAAATDAPIRIAVGADELHHFHNCFIHLDESKPPAERYRALLGLV